MKRMNIAYLKPDSSTFRLYNVLFYLSSILHFNKFRLISIQNLYETPTVNKLYTLQSFLKEADVSPNSPFTAHVGVK